MSMDRKANNPIIVILSVLVLLLGISSWFGFVGTNGLFAKKQPLKERTSIHLGSEPGESIQKILWMISDYSATGDYQKLLDCFTMRFLESLSSGFFQRKLLEQKFKLIESAILSLDTYVDQGYAVVKLRYHVGNRTVTEYNALFYRKEGTKWKVDNFPFRSVHISSWGGRKPRFD